MRNFYIKNNVFQLSHGIKNIHRSKLHVQHTLWRKTFFAAATFEGL